MVGSLSTADRIPAISPSIRPSQGHGTGADRSRSIDKIYCFNRRGFMRRVAQRSWSFANGLIRCQGVEAREKAG